MTDELFLGQRRLAHWFDEFGVRRECIVVFEARDDGYVLIEIAGAGEYVKAILEPMDLFVHNLPEVRSVVAYL